MEQRSEKELSPQELRVTEALKPFGIRINQSAWNAVIAALPKPGDHAKKAWVYDKDGEGKIVPVREASELFASGEYFDTPTGGQEVKEVTKTKGSQEETDWATLDLKKNPKVTVKILLAKAAELGINPPKEGVKPKKADILTLIQEKLQETV